MASSMDTVRINDIPFGFAMHRILFRSGRPEDIVLLSANYAYGLLFSKPEDVLNGRPLSQLFPALLSENDGLYLKKVAEMLSGENTEAFELYVSDIKKHLKIQLRHIREDVFSSSLIDITDELRHREILRLAMLSMNDGVLVTDTSGRIGFLNNGAEQVLGASPDAITGRNVFDVLRLFESDETPFSLEEYAQQLAAQENPAESRWNHLLLRNMRGDILIPVEVSLTVIRNGSAGQGLMVMLRNIRERLAFENRISFITYHDALTGLYNRTFFKENEEAFGSSSRLPLALIMGDVNGLKLTNDAFGHLKGDELLRASAEAITSACREIDFVVRWGGDEFIVLLPRTDAAGAEEVCRRIRANAGRKKIGFLDLSISLGYAVRHAEQSSLDELLKEAEDRMYDEKLLESRSVKSRTIELITRTLYERSREESRHAENVSRLCGLLGQAMQLDVSMIAELIILGKVHDIGKIGIDLRALLKPGPLTESEWQDIRRHSEIGYRILLSDPEMAKTAEFVLMHHEHYDGTGYPNGKRGFEILLPSRIVSVAEAYDAMTSDQPYRKKKTPEGAVEELRRCAGTQFDPAVVETFITSVLPLRNQSGTI